MTIEELRAALESVETQRRGLHAEIGTAEPNDDQAARWEKLDSEETEARAKLAEAEETEARRARVAESRSKWGSVQVGATKTDPYALDTRSASRAQVVSGLMRSVDGAGIEADNMAHVEQVFRRHADDRQWAANLIGRSRPEYASGFAKVLAGRAELLNAEERAAMSVGSNTNGGYLLPTQLDPTLILTNSGTSNVIRGLSRVVTLTEGVTWHGVTTAGVTASWDGELAEVSDDSPTVGSSSIATNVAQAFVQGSLASLQDIANLSQDVMMLFGDAKDRLEGAAHATGSGSSNQPKGIFTACNASSGVQVTSTTGAVIGQPDIHAVYRTLPVRFRGKATWLMNPLYSLAIKALGTALSSSYTGNLNDPVTDRILGRPAVDSDDAPTTQTTTALDNEIVFGDFSNYVIVDKPGGMSVQYVPTLFNTANNLPDGRVGWFAYWRTGADASNLNGFRMLVDKTTA